MIVLTIVISYKLIIIINKLLNKMAELISVLIQLIRNGKVMNY